MSTNDNHECEEYPDIHRQVPSGASDDEKQAIAEQNENSARVYRALRHILIHDFGFTKHLPVEPKDFPGELNEAKIANYLAVHGIMLADNWTDPAMGRDRASGEDISTVSDDKKPLLIARRFADAAVAAVQEYTSRAVLYQKVFELLKNQSKPQTGSAYRASSTTSAV